MTACPGGQAESWPCYPPSQTAKPGPRGRRRRHKPHRFVWALL